MGKQFGLRVFCFWKSLFQHLGNLLVELLAAALEQRLIRRVLDQGMLEEVGALRRCSSLIKQFRSDQLTQPLLSMVSSTGETAWSKS